jgi:holo-[acyl-carrier protein] synthase
VTTTGLGVDLIEIDRVAAALARHGGRFAERCFTPAERAYCDSRARPAQHYAGRFAAKEAVGKALGTGVPFTWREIEIAGPGRPRVILSGWTLLRALELQATEIEVSITHSRTLAAAIAAVRPR